MKKSFSYIPNQSVSCFISLTLLVEGLYRELEIGKAE